MFSESLSGRGQPAKGGGASYPAGVVRIRNEAAGAVRHDALLVLLVAPVVPEEDHDLRSAKLSKSLEKSARHRGAAPRTLFSKNRRFTWKMDEHRTKMGGGKQL